MRSTATGVDNRADTGVPVESFPLTPAQTAIWYAQRIRPEIPLVVAQYAEFRGDLDPGLLLYAIERFGAETGAGQVRIVSEDGVPRQLVDPWARPGWARVDLRGEPDPRAAALDWMRADIGTPMDFEHDPLVFNAILRTGEEQYLWYSRVHHIVIDGYAVMNGLVRTAEIYTAYREGNEPSVSRATGLRQLYAGENDYLTSARREIDRDYWREVLTGAGAGVSLAGNPGEYSGRERELSAETATAGRRLVDADLPGRIELALPAAAAAHEVSQATLFAAAMACYVRAMTGTDDVLLSLPVSARTTVSLRRSAGVVSNVVPLRVRFTAATTVSEVVHAVDQQIIGALRHQRYRHDDIRRDRGHCSDARGFFGPMINIMLFARPLRFADVRTSVHVLATGPVEDFSVNVYNADGGPIQFDIEANARLYGEREIAAHHERLCGFLERFVGAAPTTPVRELPVPTDAERAQLEAWNDTEVPIEPGTLAGIFEDRVRRCPDRVAVEFDRSRLTYGELDRRANRLARRLIAAGAGPERVVGLYLRRGLDLIVGLYAVVKTGAAYLPLDPDHPAGRTRRIIERVRPVAVLTGTAEAPESPANTIVAVDDSAGLAGFDSAPVTDSDRLAPLRP
ncbi:MAG: AMP-binding protein, partial [Nocardia sp.]|nr:AMP-binding protein [Nocardia sp.]